MSDHLTWQADIRPAETAFFLDVDGTLLGFKDRPEDVVADAELVDLLSRLKEVSGRAVALVSGRTLADLDRIVAPLVLPAGGVHGADLRFADGRRETMNGAVLDEIRARAQAFVKSRPGLRLEDKGTTIAVHFRAAPALAGEVGRFLEDAVAHHDLMIQHGKMVAEVKSRRSHKGTAIEVLMESPPFRGRKPLFIGDDLTDEHGFETVNAMGGVSIKVGGEDESTVAHYRLGAPREVRIFLKSLCRSVSDHGEKMVS